MTEEPNEQTENSQNPYEVGYSSRLFNPAEERYQYMLHLVAYDVRHPKRLRKVAKVCQDYGIRVEYSVFECDLADDTFRDLWKDLAAEIDADEDTILAYRICGSCVQKIQSMGQPTRPETTLVYML